MREWFSDIGYQAFPGSDNDCTSYCPERFSRPQHRQEKSGETWQSVRVNKADLGVWGSPDRVCRMTTEEERGTKAKL